MNKIKKEFNSNGYYLAKNFFTKKDVKNILDEAQSIYKKMMFSLGYINDMNVSNEIFEKNMIKLFNSNFDKFIGCGKQCQHLINLWKLSINDKLIDFLKNLGLKKPIISTRPVLFSNNKYIAKNEINHTVPAHQDWASMQGSINSIVVWVPLMNMTSNIGPVELIPKSHINGLITTKRINGFGIVEKYKNKNFISSNFNSGDILIFNSFLIHRSGKNITNNIRWSCHFRYNDLDDPSFIKRGYPNPYIYKPIDYNLNPEFDSKKTINDYLENQ